MKMRSFIAGNATRFNVTVESMCGDNSLHVVKATNGTFTLTSEAVNTSEIESEIAKMQRALTIRVSL